MQQDNRTPDQAPLALARGATDQPLIEQTIGECFDAMVARQPEHEALVSVHQGLRYSYRQLQQAARQLASALLGLGLQPGDRIGIWSHNNAEWVLMQLATAQVGLVLVNINPAYRTAEVEYALNKVGCRALVTMRQFKSSDYLAMLQQLAPEWAHGQPGALESGTLPHLRSVVWIDQPGQGEEVPGLLRFSELMARGRSDDPRIACIAAALKPVVPLVNWMLIASSGFSVAAMRTMRGSSDRPRAISSEKRNRPGTSSPWSGTSIQTTLRRCGKVADSSSPGWPCAHSGASCCSMAR